MHPPRHVIECQQFNPEFITSLYRKADEYVAMLDRVARNRSNARLLLRSRFAGYLALIFFYEPSTRTRLSFEMAARELGMEAVVVEHAGTFSSVAKGETLEDTIRVLEGYHPDVIILRHRETGAAARAAAVSSVPIVNAGDGTGQHPAQALLDLYTTDREIGRLCDLRVVIGGDLAYGRTVRSFAYLLAKFPRISITFIAPPVLAIGDDIKNYLARHEVPFTETQELEPAFRSADIVYWTRIQKERMTPEIFEQTKGKFVIGPEEFSWLRPDARLLHPLPRIGEIVACDKIDNDPRAAFFRQAAYGIPLRMALLDWILSDDPTWVPADDWSESWEWVRSGAPKTRLASLRS